VRSLAARYRNESRRFQVSDQLADFARHRKAMFVLDSGALKKRAQDFFSFEKLAGDFAGGQ
jgi:hypothetical protein